MIVTLMSTLLKYGLLFLLLGGGSDLLSTTSSTIVRTGSDKNSKPVNESDPDVYKINTTLVLDETINNIIEDSAKTNKKTDTDVNKEESNEFLKPINFPDAQVEPTVFIALLVRNKAHTLPYFLTLLEKLDYPKDRIAIW